MKSRTASRQPAGADSSSSIPLSVPSIAREIGLGERQARRLLAGETAGEPRRSARMKPDEILRLRRHGRTLTGIGRFVGYSRQAVRRADDAGLNGRATAPETPKHQPMGRTHDPASPFGNPGMGIPIPRLEL